MKFFFNKILNTRLVKAFIYLVIGIITYPGLNLINRLRISGMEHLENLPKQNVLFVSNHETYFADVITFIHIFCAVAWRKKNGLGIPYYLLWPFTRIKYVAAEETMKSNWLTRLFTLAGALTVKRTWKAETGERRRGLDPSDTRKINSALQHNWVITFPQGTTQPFAPGRKGTAFIIRQNKPIVIPVQVSGFRKAFDKQGLRLRKRGSTLRVKFMPPMNINYNDSTDDILAQIMDAIGQSKRFMPQAHAEAVAG